METLENVSSNAKKMGSRNIFRQFFCAKFTGASRNSIPGPVKFPVKRPVKLSGAVVTGSFEKQAPARLPEFPVSQCRDPC